MIILGIDPGLATTGYGVIKKTKKDISVIDWGVIETEKKIPLEQRLEAIHHDLIHLISKYKPEIIVVESIFFAKNVKTALSVSQARGVILLTAKLQKVKILELTPLQVKSQIAGYGSASKQQVQFMVKKLLKLNLLPKPDDAADALALAFCGSNKH
jgi:crossover junction endodeoxyribonuclease RuvC